MNNHSPVIKFFMLLGTLLLLVSGCATHVPISIKDNLESHQITNPNKAIIVIPTSLATKVHTKGGLVFISTSKLWKIGIGETIQQSVEPFFRNYFQELSIDTSNQGTNCSNCGLMIKPALENIHISSITLQTTLELSFSFYDSLGRKVYISSARGQSPAMDATRASGTILSLSLPLIGEFIGSHLVQSSVEKAFINAYKTISKDLDYQFSEGKLARTWLEKDLLRKRSYGKFEYSAEKYASAQGCNLSTDGIKLIAQEIPISETYEAKCFQQGHFLIECSSQACKTKI